MSTSAVLQLALVVVAISVIVHGAYGASLLAGALASGLVVLTLLVWMLADWLGRPPD